MRRASLAIAAVAGVFLLGACGTQTTSSGDGSGSSPSATQETTPPAQKTTSPVQKTKPHVADKVVFKVWGKAPSGVDITYGSDSDNRDASTGNLPVMKKLKVTEDAEYYALTAQLNGSGDISCSVTIGKEVAKGHASGSFNICDAQLSRGLMGGWEK